MRTFTLLFLCSLALHGFTQDRLLLTDGQEVLVWITEVGENYLKYIHADKKEDSEFNIPKRMVAKIVYATGDEKVFRPVQTNPPLASSPAVHTDVKVESLTSESPSDAKMDVIHLMNGGNIEATVSEINDTHIEYIVENNSHRIPVSEISAITYVDGSEEQFHQANSPLDTEAARKASVAYRKKRLEIQNIQSPEGSEIASSDSRRGGISESSLELSLMGGLNLITGMGPGKRDLNWMLLVAKAELPPHEDAMSTGKLTPTVGIHLGIMAGYALNSYVKLIGGLQISQKGFVSVRTLSYLDAESGNRWVLATREREQMLHLDLPIGIEASILPKLEVQAGLLGSLVVNGSTFVKTDTDVFSPGGSRLEDVSSDVGERRPYQGLGLTKGGFFGVRVPLSSQLGLHLRMLVNTGGGYEGAFANTVIQMGAAYRL